MACLRILFTSFLLATFPVNFLIGSWCSCVVFVLPAHLSRLVRFFLVFRGIPIFPLSLLLCLVYYVIIFGSLVTTIVLSTFLLMPMWHCGKLNRLFAFSSVCISAIVSGIVLFARVGLLTASSDPFHKGFYHLTSSFPCLFSFVCIVVSFFRCVCDVFARRHGGCLHWWYCRC